MLLVFLCLQNRFSSLLENVFAMQFLSRTPLSFQSIHLILPYYTQHIKLHIWLVGSLGSGSILCFVRHSRLYTQTLKARLVSHLSAPLLLVQHKYGHTKQSERTYLSLVADAMLGLWHPWRLPWRTHCIVSGKGAS